MDKVTNTVGIEKKMQGSLPIRRTILDIISKSKASHTGPFFSIVEILSAIYGCVDIE